MCNQGDAGPVLQPGSRRELTIDIGVLVDMDIDQPKGSHLHFQNAAQFELAFSRGGLLCSLPAGGVDLHILDQSFVGSHVLFPSFISLTASSPRV